MAKPRRPSRWFTQLGREHARERAKLLVSQQRLAPDDVADYVSAAGLRERLATRDYMSRAVKDLRKFFKGFEAKDGYDLSQVHTWDAQRAKTVREYGQYLHGLQASPYVVASPSKYHGAKRKTFKRQLQLRTQQASPRQKKYIWHVEQTERETDIRMSREGQLEVSEKLPAQGEFIRRFWYFRDYNKGKQPLTFGQIVKATIRMLEDLPEHMWFTIINSSHGPIDVPVSKEFLLQTLQRYQDEYGRPDNAYLHDGFGETLIGVMFAGTREQALKSYNERLQRRMRQGFEYRRKVQERRRRVAFQKKMGRVR